MADQDLAFLSATELVEHYRAKTLSPVEATRASLAQIGRHGDKLNAFVLVDEDSALAAAKASEDRWRTGEPKGLVDRRREGVRGPLAIGTDGGGSIRIPASFAGIFGIKATFGRVPAYPSSPFGSVAHVGPMTRTVADAALMLTVIAGPDVRDWTALPYDEEDYRRNLDQPLSGVRVAYSETLGMPDVRLDPEVRDCVATAARSFQSLGATVVETDPVWPHEPGAVFGVYWSIGATKLIDDMTDDHVAKMEDSLTFYAGEGRKLSGLDIKVAELQRTANGVALNRFFEDHDLLLSPTMPIPAFDAGVPVPSDDYAAEPLRWTPYTFPINLAKNPAASVPCGFTGAGLPVGLHVIGPMYREVAVLRAARAYEQAHDWHARRPGSVTGA
jgi:aspartyl-tRNA(Asn)/glutamyl-tRNA(Gln) amidotransferase subunit A